MSRHENPTLGAGVRLLAGKRLWVIGTALALITAINYLDRQALPVVIGELKKDIPITNTQYGDLGAVFLGAYALMYAAGGWLVDRLGTRVGFAVMAGVWSIACGLHAIVNSLFGLGVVRFFLGLGEGGGFPAAAKAVAEWFPARERSFAIGLFNTGSSVGAVAAPLFLPVIVVHWGWRMAFVVCALSGVVWTVAWLFIYQPANRCSWLGAAEREHLVQAGVGAAGSKSTERWCGLLRDPSMRTLMLARFLTDGPWFFLVYWMPKYFGEVRGFDIKDISVLWVAYAFAGVGSFGGGWFSGWLIGRGHAIPAARRIALAVGAPMLAFLLLVEHVNVPLAVACIGFAFFGHQFWSVILQTLPTDMFPAQRVGAAAGLLGAAACLGALVFQLIGGRLIDAADGDYGTVFVIGGIMHPISLVIVLRTLRWGRATEAIDRTEPGEAQPAEPLSATTSTKRKKQP